MRYIFITLIAVSLFLSCDDSPWKAEVPTYLLIDSFSFQTLPEEGSNSSAITDVWVYDNTGLLGAFELPAEIPILGEGEKQITLFPGIRENGNSFYPDLYFLYEPDTLTLNASNDGEVRFTPQTQYDERTEFAFIEGFENGNLFSISLTSDSTEMEVVDTMVLDGQRIGTMAVTDSVGTVVVGTSEVYGPFFESGNLAYLEMDFKSEVPVTVGYSGISSQGVQREFLKVTLKPVEDWRKVYIEFSEEFIGDDIFRVQIILRIDHDLRYLTDSVGRAYFDNIKLVHF